MVIKKYAYIDALRGWAVLFVLLVHTGVFLSTEATFPDWFSIIWKNGDKGVQLFFILSAITLFMSYDKRKEKYSLVNFYIRRFFRIAPLYYFAIVLYNLLIDWYPYVMKENSILVDFTSTLSAFSFSFALFPNEINSFVPGSWSIGVEVMFYAILPLLFYLIKNLRVAIIYFLVSAYVSCIVHFYLISHPFISDIGLWSLYLYYFFINQIPVFLLGIIVFFLINNKFEKVITSIDLTVISIVLIAQVILMQVFWQLSYVFNEMILVSIFLMLFVYSLSKNEIPLFVNRITILIGKISYSMYILHFLVIYVMLKMNLYHFTNSSVLNFVISYLILLLASIMVSIISYYSIEKLFINIGAKMVLIFEK